MFKGKKGVYILVAINVCIWSFFIYRFCSAYVEDDLAIKEDKETIVLNEVKDSIGYKLNLSYDDPFLKKEITHGKKKLNGDAHQSLKAQETRPRKVKEQLKILLPEIKYFGLVKNNNNGSVTAIVSINGASKLIKQDETIDGLCFKNFTSENLIVLWNKEKIVITK